jgi:hypothetical protein
MDLVFNTTSTILQLYCGGHCYRWMKQGYLDKTTQPPQVADKLYHIAYIEYISS